MKIKQISKYYNEKIESFVRCFSVSLQHFVQKNQGLVNTNPGMLKLKRIRCGFSDFIYSPT